MLNIFNMLNGRKVLITGHTGFKGSWLCKILKMYNAEIYGYALNSELNNSLYNILNIRNIVNSERIADINDFQQLKNYINNVKPDIIFHLAAQPLVRKSYEIPKYTFETNAIGTLNVLECLRNYGKKCQVVCVTTDKVYDNNESGIPFVESDRLGGYDPYSASKAAAEIIIDSYRKSFFNLNDYGTTHEIQIASARAGNVIGGGDFAEDRIIPDIIKSVMDNRDIQIRNPFAVRPWQHVLEPLFGYIRIACMMCEGFDARLCSAFNFGPDEESLQSVGYIADSAVSAFNYRKWIDKSMTKNVHEAQTLKLNAQKARTILKWKPVMSLNSALEYTFDWYKSYLNNENVIDLTERQIREYEELVER